MARNPQRGGLGLLVDFLEHEVAEAALVRHVVAPTQERRRPLNPRSGLVVELDAQGGQQGHLPVFHRQDGAGKSGQRRGVASAEEFPFPKTNQQGRSLAGHHQRSREGRPNHGEGIGPMQARQNGLNRREQQLRRRGLARCLQAIELLAQQVRNDLGVGVRAEDHTGGLELLAQAPVVLDDPVLHHREAAWTVEVRVGVALLRLAVGRPAGVTDAALPLGPLGLKTGREVRELALSAQTGQPCISSNCGNAG